VAEELPACSGRAGAEPIRDEELQGLFASTASQQQWVLAVSGGADSVALMVLVRRWMDMQQASTGHSPLAGCVVATVDHGLRPESAGEADWVAARARSLGFAHETLTWHGEKPKAGVQAAARQARHRLLGEFARRHGGAWQVVTAHHLDDQVETFFMRLARGSGIDGLAAMSGQVTLTARDGRGEDFPVRIVRPLLWVPKMRLVATLTQRGMDWLEDPSNENVAFERVRWRRLMPALAAEGLTAEQIGRSIRRLQRTRAAMPANPEPANPEQAYSPHGGAVNWHQGAYATIDWDRCDAGADARIQVIAAVLRELGRSETPVRLMQIEAACAHFDAPGAETLTLGDCVLEIRRNGPGLTVTREPGRRGLPVVELSPGNTVSWDRRFQVCLSASMEGPVTVRAFDGPTWAALKRGYKGAHYTMPHRAAMTLPSIWQGQKLLAVPHLAGLDPALSGPRANEAPLIRVIFNGEDVGATQGICYEN
jgi:tRNA(Ile)-lysidine synthase